MECPVCHESMVVIEYASIELDYCVGCMGVWFDSGEIELLFESAGLSVPPDSIAFHSVNQEIRELQRPCPLCRKLMKKVSPPGSQVVLDQCPENEGLWFDSGEIAGAVKDLVGDNSTMVLDVLHNFLGNAILPSNNREA